MTKPKVPNLRSLRLEQGFPNRTEFATACGVDRVTVWRWENGDRGMSAEMCQRVARVLGVDVGRVLEAVGNDYWKLLN